MFPPIVTLCTCFPLFICCSKEERRYCLHLCNLSSLIHHIYAPNSSSHAVERVDGSIILRWIFRKWVVGAWNGLIWLTVGTAVVNAVMNLQVLKNAENFLISWEPVKFSKRTVRHGMIEWVSKWVSEWVSYKTKSRKYLPVREYFISKMHSLSVVDIA